MPADSLVDMARRACMKSSRNITDIADVPYDLLRPVLLKIENPEQLYQLEQNSPQIIGKDREIWLSMLKRDIPDYESKPHQPSDPKNWYKVYRKLKREVQQEMAAGDEKLKAALSFAQQKKGVPTTRVISTNELPRQTVRKRQAIVHDYNSGRTGSKGAHKLSIMDKIRKESRGASTAKMSRPTHELQKRSSQIVKAPQSFVRDIKQQNLAKVPINQAREAMGYGRNNPPKPLPRPAGSAYDMTQDREARLRSLKAGKSAADQPIPSRETGDSGSDTRNQLTLDFLEDSDNDDDELFGMTSKSKANPNKRSASPRPRMTSPKPVPPRKRSAPKLFMASPASKRKRPSPGIT